MRRVITASLNGNAYQIEDDAYAVLAAYLEDAARALASDPDKDEIIADVEQAIADKCARYLSSHKSVIARAEIDQVLTEMGPVDAGGPTVAPSSAGASSATPGTDPRPATGAAGAEPGATARRLYQISDGALISGVCNGLAAYFHIDVSLVRVLFVALVFLTGGMAIVAYLVLMFVVPYAKTSEEHAAARGIPFNARTLVEGAKQKAAEFTHGGDWQQSRAEWRAEWRRTQAQWRAEWRRTRAEWRSQRGARPAPFVVPPVPPMAAPPPPHVPYAAHLVTGLVMTLLGLFLTLFTIGWVIALIMLITTGALFGWMLPIGIPWWLGIILMIVVYEIVAWPIKAIRHARYQTSPYQPWRSAGWDGIAGFAVLAVLLWYGYHHLPGLHDFIEHLRSFWEQTVDA